MRKYFPLDRYSVVSLVPENAAPAAGKAGDKAATETKGKAGGP